jgi:hypothetical protein
MESIYHHKFLGKVEVTDACRELNRNNPDKTTIFIEYEDDVREVTKNLIKEFYEIMIRTVDTSGNIIKEDTIETKLNDQLIFERSDSITPTFISSGSTLIIKFETNKAPEEHLNFHNTIIEKIKTSKELGKKGILFVEQSDQKTCSQLSFSWGEL